jgi:hypothetical protein
MKLLVPLSRIIALSLSVGSFGVAAEESSASAAAKETVEGSIRNLNSQEEPVPGELPCGFTSCEYGTGDLVPSDLNPDEPTACDTKFRYDCSDGWSISFNETLYDPVLDETTFVYLVTNPNCKGCKAISHVTYGWTGKCCITKVSYFGESIVDGGQDPTTCLNGIKFDKEWGSAKRDSGELYSVTFKGQHMAQPGASDVAIKGGSKYCTYVVDGPDCGKCEPDPSPA